MSLVVYTYSDDIIKNKIEFNPTNIILISKNNILKELEIYDPIIIDDSEILLEKYNLTIKEIPFVLKIIGNNVSLIQGKNIFNLKNLTLTEKSSDTLFKRSVADENKIVKLKNKKMIKFSKDE